MNTKASQQHNNKNTLEKKVEQITATLHDFIDTQFLTSILLFCCMLLAIFLSNIDGIKEYYYNFINMSFGFYLNDYVIHTTLHEFVNNFLLALFFFILGLEIKREFISGELSEVSKSLYVILCAIGGAVLPIIIFITINMNSPETFSGWAIPMATDTALAIGVLYLFKNKMVPTTFTLIASLAIIDDILSIIVIAIFYSAHFNFLSFLLAVVLFLFLIIINLCGFRRPFVYIIIGFLLWLAIQQAGIHGTIAGVLLAMCIPARPKKLPKGAIKNIRKLINKFEYEYNDKKHLLEEEKPHQLLEGVTDVSLDATTPLKRWENRLEVPVLILVLPLFALTAGGFHINFSQWTIMFNSPLFWGIFIGLVIAKPLGIIITSYFIQKIGIAKLPDGLTIHDVIIVSFLAGIGYTMSIFITELSFSSMHYIDMAKLAILISSFVSAFIAIIYIQKKPKRSGGRKNEKNL